MPRAIHNTAIRHKLAVVVEYGVITAVIALTALVGFNGLGPQI
jgi:Flp pilus assembly pilin Flp